MKLQYYQKMLVLAGNLLATKTAGGERVNIVDKIINSVYKGGSHFSWLNFIRISQLSEHDFR